MSLNVLKCQYRGVVLFAFSKILYTLEAVSCPYVRSYVRKTVGVASSVANDVIMRMTSQWHVAMGLHRSSNVSETVLLKENE